jgi:hypothetical protein
LKYTILSDTFENENKYGYKTMKINRIHLKKALDEKNWDLLDLLLEIDNSNINDPSYYSDTWGSYWGLLVECIFHREFQGILILLNHGIDKEIGVWGDGPRVSALEIAKEKKMFDVIDLLNSTNIPKFLRASNPPIPDLNVREKIIDDKFKTNIKNGVVFPLD